MTNDVAKRRLAKAVAITVMAVMCIPAIDALAYSGAARVWDEVAQSSASSGAARAGIDAAALIGDGGAGSFLSRLESAAAIQDASLPEAFEREVGLPGQHRDLRVSGDGTVVRCVVDAPPDAVAKDVGARMEAGGWREVPLGSLEGSTYVKPGGECAWVLVTCTEAGAATGVVFRCVYR